VFLDERNGFDAVFSLADQVDFGKALKQVGELFAGGLFVIDDNGVDGHLHDSHDATCNVRALVSEYRRRGRFQANKLPGGQSLSADDGIPVSCAAEKWIREGKMKKPSESLPRGKAKVLSSEMVYEGKVFGVRRDDVVEPSGVRATREFVTHPGSVVVLPLLGDGRIVLIRQYRHAAKQYLWELVAGRIDEGERPQQAAARELIEETGYRAKSLRIFLDVFPTPGFLEERMYILLAEGLTSGEARPEEDEKIISRAYNRKELEEMIRTGKLRDAKTIAGLLYYFRFLARGSKRRRFT
jgi:ADP-ribose pyrophosphatase